MGHRRRRAARRQLEVPVLLDRRQLRRARRPRSRQRRHLRLERLGVRPRLRCLDRPAGLGPVARTSTRSSSSTATPSTSRSPLNIRFPALGTVPEPRHRQVRRRRVDAVLRRSTRSASRPARRTSTPSRSCRAARSSSPRPAGGTRRPRHHGRGRRGPAPVHAQPSGRRRRARGATTSRAATSGSVTGPENVDGAAVARRRCLPDHGRDLHRLLRSARASACHQPHAVGARTSSRATRRLTVAPRARARSFSMFFDGSAVGVNNNLDAIDVP